MENAAKALQMAAGVLISVLVLGLIAYSYNNLSATKRVEQEAIREEQAVNFNKSFEGYNKEKLTGSEMISLANKVEDYNKRYLVADGYTKIKLTVSEIKPQTKYPNYKSANNNVNVLSNIHKTLLDNIKAKGDLTYTGTSYKYKELYAMYKKSSDIANLFSILGVSTTAEVRSKVETWEYTKLINEQEDFSRTSFKRTEWKYDNYGRISEIKFKME